MHSCNFFPGCNNNAACLQVRVTDVWDQEDDRVVLAFGRSMG